MKPILFSIGPFALYSYGLLLAFSLLFGLFIVWRLYKNNIPLARSKVTIDLFFDTILIFFLSFGIGARLLHIVEHWSFFAPHLLLWFLFLHFPGFSFFGGLIGGILGLWLFAKKKKLPLYLLLDLCLIGTAFVLSISRIGSLLSGDAVGIETTLLGVKMQNLPGLRHPVQAYESILAFFIFAFLYYLFVKGKQKPGMISLYALLLLAIQRFFLDMLRMNSVYLGEFTIAQLLSALFVLTTGGVITYFKQAAIIAFAKRSFQKVKSVRIKKS